jgi:hypothetical protein
MQPDEVELVRGPIETGTHVVRRHRRPGGERRARENEQQEKD